MMIRKSMVWLIVCLCSSIFISASSADWPRFRGPNGSGVSTDQLAPATKWSPTKNVKWKAALPGAGVSSPIVIGDRIFVTCYSGYGLDRSNPGEINNLKRHLVCVDAKSGDIVWNKTIDAIQPEDPYTGIGVTAHGYASHSPVSDGERVYVFFGKTGALAFDLDGKKLWQTSLGTESDPRRWGSSSSPILYKDLLIVTASAESQALVGLDCVSGKEVWRLEASGLDNFWGTPVLDKINEKRTDLVVGVPREIWGISPDDGKLKWFCEATGADQANSSVVLENNIAFVVTGRGGGSVAVRTGGKGDVSDSLLWTGRETARFGTPVVYQKRLYLIANKILNVIDAKSGEKISQKRLVSDNSATVKKSSEAQAPVENGDNPAGGRQSRGSGRFGGGGGFGSLDYASPIIAGGKLYYLNGTGEMFVFSLGDEPTQISVNRVTEETETFGGTPAVSHGQLFIRSNKHLYCVVPE